MFRAQSERAAEIVEFSIVALPAILLFSLIVDGGLHMYYKSFLSHGTSLVARQMATDVRGTLTCPTLLNSAPARVEEYVSGVLDITGIETQATFRYSSQPGAARGVCILTLEVSKVSFGGTFFGILRPRAVVEVPVEDICFDCNSTLCGGT